MFGAAVFCALLAVAAAQAFPPFGLSSSCAATLCVQGTICREVFNQATGTVQAQCLNAGQTSSQKPGQCPAVQQGSVGICASNCRSDADCRGARKCCRNPCGARTCQNPAQFTPGPQRASCDTVRCGQGQTCVMQQLQCFRGPCFAQPTCVAAVVDKPGRCPRRTRRQTSGQCGTQCQSDAECPGNSKCCRSRSCGQTCQQPFRRQRQRQTQFTCANVDCLPGYSCTNQAVPCFTPPCPTRPVCTSTVVVTVPARSRCPVFPAFVNPLCVRRDQCLSGGGFSSCPPGTQCCSTPCGRRCV